MDHTHNNIILFSNDEEITSSSGEVYDYKDHIYKNQQGNGFMRWKAPKKNTAYDQHILTNNNIHIWHRSKNGCPYKYLGKVNNKKIYQERRDEQLMIVDLYFDTKNSTIPLYTVSEIYDYRANDTHKFTKYKMDCFTKLNLRPKGNWCSGIMEGI